MLWMYRQEEEEEEEVTYFFCRWCYLVKRACSKNAWVFKRSKRRTILVNKRMSVRGEMLVWHLLHTGASFTSEWEWGWGCGCQMGHWFDDDGRSAWDFPRPFHIRHQLVLFGCCSFQVSRQREKERRTRKRLRMFDERVWIVQCTCWGRFLLVVVVVVVDCCCWLLIVDYNLWCWLLTNVLHVTLFYLYQYQYVTSAKRRAPSKSNTSRSLTLK